MLVSFALFKIFHLQQFTWPQLPQKTLPQLSLHPDCGCGSPACPFWFHQTFLRCPETDPCDGGRDMSELGWTDRRYKVGRTILKLLHSPSWCCLWWEDRPDQFYGERSNMFFHSRLTSPWDTGCCKDSFLWTKCKTTASPLLLTAHTMYSFDMWNYKKWEQNMAFHCCFGVLAAVGTQTWCIKPRVCQCLAVLPDLLCFPLATEQSQGEMLLAVSSTASLSSRIGAWYRAEEYFSAWTGLCGLILVEDSVDMGTKGLQC